MARLLLLPHTTVTALPGQCHWQCTCPAASTLDLLIDDVAAVRAHTSATPQLQRRIVQPHRRRRRRGALVQLPNDVSRGRSARVDSVTTAATKGSSQLDDGIRPGAAGGGMPGRTRAVSCAGDARAARFAAAPVTVAAARGRRAADGGHVCTRQ